MVIKLSNMEPTKLGTHQSQALSCLMHPK